MQNLKDHIHQNLKHMANTKEHLIVIIDRKLEQTVTPKIYYCPVADKTKDQAIRDAKHIYEKTHNNRTYESFYFEH